MELQTGHWFGGVGTGFGLPSLGLKEVLWEEMRGGEGGE